MFHLNVPPGTNMDPHAGIHYGITYFGHVDINALVRAEDAARDPEAEGEIERHWQSAQQCLAGVSDWGEEDWSRDQRETLEYYHKVGTSEDEMKAVIFGQMEEGGWEGGEKLEVRDWEGYDIDIDRNDTEICVRKSDWVAICARGIMNGGFLNEPEAVNLVPAYALGPEFYDEYSPMRTKIIPLTQYLKEREDE